MTRPWVPWRTTSLSLAGNSGRLTWVRHSSRKSSATYSYQCVVFLCVRTMVWLPVLGIFNVRTDVDACDCTRVLYGPVRVCLASPGARTGVSITPWPFSRMLYPLSCHGPGKSDELLRLRRRGEVPPPRSCGQRLWRLNTGPPVSTPFAAFPQRPRCCKRLGVDQLGV